MKHRTITVVTACAKSRMGEDPMLIGSSSDQEHFMRYYRHIDIHENNCGTDPAKAEKDFACGSKKRTYLLHVHNGSCDCCLFFSGSQLILRHPPHPPNHPFENFE